MVHRASKKKSCSSKLVWYISTLGEQFIIRLVFSKLNLKALFQSRGGGGCGRDIHLLPPMKHVFGTIYEDFVFLDYLFS